jgi:ribosomal protein L30
LRGLGLRQPHHIVEVEDSAAVRGMVAKVQHLIVVLEG